MYTCKYNHQVAIIRVYILYRNGGYTTLLPSGIFFILAYRYAVFLLSEYVLLVPYDQQTFQGLNPISTTCLGVQHNRTQCCF
jgi:hypothetical protein